MVIYELETWPEVIKMSRDKPLMLSALGGKLLFEEQSLILKPLYI